MADQPHADEIVLSDERRALLAPKLRALLDDFAKLADLETLELEPATAPPAKGDGDERH